MSLRRFAQVCSHCASVTIAVDCCSAAVMADRGLLVMLDSVRISGGHRWIDMERIVRILLDNLLKVSNP